ncbi:hypothetical protein P7C70_g598, partial [Phenoliferia sp. Uapishka_3]
MDPLAAPSPTYTNEINPSLSPLAPRPPLPGERTGHYRPQPLPPPPSTSAWASPPLTPNSNGHSNSNGHGAQWADAPPRRSPSGSLTPRSPQSRPSRPLRDADEDDDNSFSPTRTQGGAVAQITKSPPVDGFVRIKIVGLDKNRRDVYLKFNAEVRTFSLLRIQQKRRNLIIRCLSTSQICRPSETLPGAPKADATQFTHATSPFPPDRSVSRSYSEFAKFSEAIAANNPQSIIPALPLVQSSAATEDDDDRLVKSAFQRWIARVTTDPAIVRDDELRSFVESEFGYTPSTRARRKTPSTFHFPRGQRLPGEQDDELTLAKAAMSKLELNFTETARAVEKVAKARRNVAIAVSDVGDHMNAFATTETYNPLANGIKKLARTTKISADLAINQATSELVSLGDAMSYQASNARAAKDTLVSRDVILDEHRTAAKATIARRRAIEKMRGSSSIKADRVDEALEELDDAKRQEVLLSQRLIAISQNLQPSLRAHSRNAHSDILSALLDHARSSLMYEKQLLKELEVLRPELHAIKKPEPGVYYHTTVTSPNPLRVSSSAAMSRDPSNTSSQATTKNGGPPLSSTSPITSRTPNGNGNGNGKNMAVGRGGPNFANPLGDDGFGPAGTMVGGNAGRRSIRGMAKSVVVTDDKRQRVDARMAASMLANGF